MEQHNLPIVTRISIILLRIFFFQSVCTFSLVLKHGCVSLNSKNTIRELLSEICMHNALHFHKIFYLYIKNGMALHVLEYIRVCIILFVYWLD